MSFGTEVHELQGQGFGIFSNNRDIDDPPNIEAAPAYEDPNSYFFFASVHAITSPSA
jgi:hypothetical protein